LKDSSKILEEVKKQGKFKLIRNSRKREKKKKLKSGDRMTKCDKRKRKKHKVEAEPQTERKTEIPRLAEILTLMPTTSKENTGPKPKPEPESKFLEDDFDVFVNAGKY